LTERETLVRSQLPQELKSVEDLVDIQTFTAKEFDAKEAFLADEQI
jgi:hypothetical protein